jgi:hypothetical protein
MPRYTLVFWTCPLPCGNRNDPSSRSCPNCGALHYERYANVRESEKTYIDVAPDGSISMPGRLDCPLDPKQIAHGVQRIPVDSALAGQYSLKALEQRGLVHEATNWNSAGDNVSPKVEEMPDLTPKSVEQILSEPDVF